MTASLTRRRFIGITAAAAGLGLVPLGSTARAGGNLVTWRGQAMGAVATLQVHHHDRAAAQRLIEGALAEIRRLERVFSLYRADSALVALNRHRVLVAPPADLVELVAVSRHFFEITGGAFDPSVQALWTLYRDHFSDPEADPQGPSERARRAALERVGFDRVVSDPDRISLPDRGMALTFNGIAQGYASDRVVQILRAGGVEHSLVDMGEPRVMGCHPSGGPWRVGLADSDQPSRIAETLEVVDRAVATSGGYGFHFDREGRFHHLLDPRTGWPGNLYKSVTVVLPSATSADALSTAFCFLPFEGMAPILGRIGGGEIRLVTADGERRTLRV
jgi:thiamine biosynthesis lipoprotein